MLSALIQIMALLACSLAAPDSNLWSPQVTIESGPIVGLQTTLPGSLSPVNKYLGIPFAAPPRRFEPPEPPERWESPLEVMEFGDSCPQNFGLGTLGPEEQVLGDLFNALGPVNESENCLTINVFAPASKGTKDRPVLVFIPGGGFQLGNSVGDFSPFPAYEDIVVVSFNYRTNVFGFPHSSAIPLSERNLGLLDQHLALSWVQRNVASFGGDPDKVTIWGQSAGAQSIDQHLRSYALTSNSSSSTTTATRTSGDAPPFRAAIMSSGQMSFSWTAFPTEGDESWIALASAVGCGGEDDDDEEARLACLKTVQTDAVVDAMMNLSLAFTPTFEGVTALAGGGQAWRDGDVIRVPILSGAMADEGRLLTNRNATLDQLLGAFLPSPPFPEELVDAIANMYQEDPQIENEFDMMAAVSGDLLFQCPQVMLATAAATHVPSYFYYGNFTATAFLPDEYAYLKKFHAADMILVVVPPDDARHTPQSRALAATMRGVFADFTRNPDLGPGWDALGDNDTGYVAVIGDVGSEDTSGFAVRALSVINARCEPYNEIFNLMEQFLSG